MPSTQKHTRISPPNDDDQKDVSSNITSRLMIRAFAAIMVGFVLASFLHIRESYTFREAALLSRVNLLSELQAAALAGPLWRKERDAMKNILERLDKSPNFRGARVSDPSGKVVVKTGFLSTHEKLVTARRQITWSNNAGQTRLIGYVDIALKRDGLNADLYNAIIVTFAVALGMLGVMFVAIYVATRWIAQPIDVLNTHIHALANGKHTMMIPYQSRDDEIGRLARAIAVLKDNAFELNDLRGDLNREVYAQTRVLHAQKVKADNASRAKSKFLSTMSHEMRTPLNAIMGYAQLMEMEARQNGNVRDQDAHNQIMLASRQLLDLLSQVLNLSAIEFGGSIATKVKTLPLDGIVKEVVEQAQSLAAKHQVTIEQMAREQTTSEQTTGHQTTETCWRALVRVDPILLRQAMGALLSNAIQYNKPGGNVKVTCEEKTKTCIRVLIADDGEGIATADQDRIFQPFSRVVDENTANEGLGIGLPIARKLIESIDGTLGFKSTEGKGSTFWVDLPCIVPPATSRPMTSYHGEPPVDEAAAPKAGTVLPRTVLYIEDTPANIALLEQYFALMQGPELLIATTGEEGVKVALAEKPDIILMDINLPGISGTEAMQELRAHGGEFADIQIIAISADSAPAEIERALAAGFDDYITKPIQLSILKAALKKNLG